MPFTYVINNEGFVESRWSPDKTLSPTMLYVQDLDGGGGSSFGADTIRVTRKDVQQVRDELDWLRNQAVTDRINASLNMPNFEINLYKRYRLNEDYVTTRSNGRRIKLLKGRVFIAQQDINNPNIIVTKKGLVIDINKVTDLGRLHF